MASHRTFKFFTLSNVEVSFSKYEFDKEKLQKADGIIWDDFMVPKKA